jgi:hypothetical protein
MDKNKRIQIYSLLQISPEVLEVLTFIIVTGRIVTGVNL